MASYKVRVIVSDSDIRKLSLECKPDNLENLHRVIKGELQLSGEFRVQYADPDFGGDLVNLADVNDLPDNYASLKLNFLPEPSTGQPLSLNDSASLSSLSSDSYTSDSTHDTISISSSDDLQSIEAKFRKGSWPPVFEIPKLGPELEQVLDAGNMKYKADGVNIFLGKDLKSHMLDALSNKIWEYKAYPSHLEYEEVAKAVIAKFPCLTEKGSPSGCAGLVNSLKFKMGNMRSKMRSIGCFETKVNARKRLDNEATAETPCKIKKAKRAELNYLPDLPHGEDAASMEVYRKTLLAEVQKRKKDFKEVNSLMARTFAYRRQELVLSSPSTKDIIERWPGLFLTSQLQAEFGRLTNMNLYQTFFAALDEHLGRIEVMLRSRQGLHAADIQQELQSSGMDIISRRTAVLRSLPLYFKEATFYKDFEDTAGEESVCGNKETQRIAVIGPVEDPSNLSIIIDGSIVMEDITDFPSAVALYFGIHYCLNLHYHRHQGTTMELLQKVFMNIDGRKLSSKVLSFKNKMLA